MDFHQEIISELKQKEYSARQLAKLKRDLSQKYKLKHIPTNIQILLNCSVEDLNFLKKKLLTKPTRTMSGVAPVAIMTKPFPCPHAQTVGPCIMCPGGPKSEFGDVPQSYTGKEPATMRGIRNKYSAYLQVFNRLQQYILLGHNCEKVELILMGGTFPSFPEDYQEEFVKEAFQAMNDFSEKFFVDGGFDFLCFKEFFELPTEDFGNQERAARLHEKILSLKKDTSLETEQKKNETAHLRCVALCIETRPDYGMLKEGNQMLRLGCTRVELGIQSVYDDVLEKMKRGHTTQQTKDSIRTLKDLGFKVAGHYMPGLPGTDREKDLAGMKQLFTDSDYCPDMIKLYPCMVTKGTKLYDEWEKGNYKPLDAKEAASLIAEFKKSIPEYCRVMRVQRDIPTYQIAAGVEMTNLRQYIHQNYDVKCRCIRCREPKGQEVDWGSVGIKVNEYNASKGKEFFISVEDTKNDFLVGFLRMRFPAESLREEITFDSAIVRELHIYGTATSLGSEGSVQHRGWGKKLLLEAEKIAKEHSKNKVVIISGIGVRGYYQKLGYELEGVYMVKDFL
ncbi:tRNA uridine(34) 5-carboxymethylaminomethyl modification radical SAM/GNAT enzyme Elp3 [Candidatus Woesearchaeota archaeon]|jgi:elongator complex protein 3|nr:tRNA uridine(34) 5-carboxymethylaminomethyl modification radical SAM/GNAT enzyme Elp3 [Candidatus Woesearchaeota archaeon]MBT4336517.1 tRNA uridine(34) 5-carboxymethylaminomethyl modification radical SAM/GNAT enzyme Elp3 [Candidatus Woesearchaeota archaeon]MBT4469385.1 tRNA uridine(34) 5-carboxymethylaminomethyl modification radical SAM/GNAT enzyme Elp3 [Candidatus Woesearchaeota archaeon]MBT6744220.1 tRNA uridine(34) 5-carboxymethylaminomethyl modification radical SAM/GNAT enzyme Elp3 [Candi